MYNSNLGPFRELDSKLDDLVAKFKSSWCYSASAPQRITIIQSFAQG